MHTSPPAWPPPRPPCSFHIAPLPHPRIRSRGLPPATCPAPRPPPAPRVPPVQPVVQTHCSPPSTLSSQPPTSSFVFSSSFPPPGNLTQRILPATFLEKILQRLL